MLIAIRQKFNGYIMGLTSVLAGQPFFVFGRNRQDAVKPGTCPLVISAEASVAVKFTIGGGKMNQQRRLISPSVAVRFTAADVRKGVSWE